MKNSILFLLLVLMAGPFAEIKAQNDTTAADIVKSRNKNIRHMLDYRFKGGSGEFERLLLQHVSYTPEALSNCVIGTVILSFNVDCENNASDLRMRNPLHYGLNEKIQSFYKATHGQWNNCKDDRYTRFEIPILFTISKTETAATGFIVVEGEGLGLRCKNDAYYFDLYTKNKEKGKVKRALEYLDILIRRDPYNQSYYELKKELLDQKQEE